MRGINISNDNPPVSLPWMANGLGRVFKLQRNWLLLLRPTVITVLGSEGISKAVYIQASLLTEMFLVDSQSHACPGLFYHICWYAFEP